MTRTDKSTGSEATKHPHMHMTTRVYTLRRYLGMDPEVDKDLLHIAEQALAAPLPKGWEERRGDDGRVVYYDLRAKKSTTQHPMDKHFRKVRGCTPSELPPQSNPGTRMMSDARTQTRTHTQVPMPMRA